MFKYSRYHTSKVLHRSTFHEPNSVTFNQNSFDLYVVMVVFKFCMCLYYMCHSEGMSIYFLCCYNYVVYLLT